ncbi:hypothetical protein L1987_58472 [Smallanthus sonchifolius]|uniref:Uncharacterized protein n=1 Tax=Smallanthus sonchifolius TaxID=185202 RepID=A0ACB9DGG2_9ASTR|nr:hypothetical protein L1987_58472 [Smallanthus sonchifolius]
MHENRKQQPAAAAVAVLPLPSATISNRTVGQLQPVLFPWADINNTLTAADCCCSKQIQKSFDCRFGQISSSAEAKRDQGNLLRKESSETSKNHQKVFWSAVIPG